MRFDTLVREFYHDAYATCPLWEKRLFGNRGTIVPALV